MIILSKPHIKTTSTELLGKLLSVPEVTSETKAIIMDELDERKYDTRIDTIP